MTEIAAARHAVPANAAPPRDVGGGPSPDGDGTAFADRLAAMLDVAVTRQGDGLPFAGGAMAATAERFNEHGLFGRPGQMPPVSDDLASDGGALPPVAATLTTVPFVTPATAEARAWGMQDDPVGATASTLARATMRPTVADAPAPVMTHATGTASAAPSGMAGPVIETTDPSDAPQPSRAPARSAPNDGAARLRIAIDRAGESVAVSVAADPTEQIDDAAVREAVSRMLARHGLTLGELKIMRRADTGAQDGRR